MRQVVQHFRTGELEIEEVPPPMLKKSGLLVRNVYSLISAGTERSTVRTARKTLLGKATERPELAAQMFDHVKREGVINTYQKIRNQLDSPKALGYSSAGVVLETSSDITEFRPGDRVACAGDGYASHAEIIFVPKNLCVPLPTDVDLKAGAFTTLGAIAMQGVRQAEVAVGDYVSVIGLGLVGLLVVQILKAAGCRVIGLDVNPDSLGLASELGADRTVLSEASLAEELVARFTGRVGADRVIIAASSAGSQPVDLAGRIARDRGLIVIVGAVSIDIPRSVYYAKELSVKLSRSYGPGRYDPSYEEGGIDYPIGYVRWTEKRNMAAFLQLVSEGKISLGKMISHVFPIEQAAKAYDMITQRTGEKYRAVLLQYGDEASDTNHGEITSQVCLKRDRPSFGSPRRGSSNNALNVGFIGAGNFAQNHLLPILSGLKSVHLRGVATARGMNAQSVGKKFGFSFCTANNLEVLQDPDIHCIFIATPHSHHAGLVVQALEEQKHVFVEKPLALSEDELTNIIRAYEKSTVELMVGYNRRFSPLLKRVKEFLQPLEGPLTINYRVNADLIPKNHWAQNPLEQGGRIIGEVCHFIDAIEYLTDAYPVKVSAETLSNNGSDTENDQSFCLTLTLSDGSLGTITYVVSGNTRMGKERIEVFGSNASAVIDDFKWARLYRGRRANRVRAKGKGHQEEVSAFMNALLEAKPSPISFPSLILTTVTTLKVKESLAKGMPIRIDYRSVDARHSEPNDLEETCGIPSRSQG